jgi:hypothetical protein
MNSFNYWICIGLKPYNLVLNSLGIGWKFLFILHLYVLISRAAINSYTFVFVFNDEFYLFDRISRLTLVLYGILTIFNSNVIFLSEAQVEVSLLGELGIHCVCLIVFNATFNNISVISWRDFILRYISKINVTLWQNK